MTQLDKNKLIEAMAKAICEAVLNDVGEINKWGEQPEAYKIEWRAEAKAALGAFLAELQDGKGYYKAGEVMLGYSHLPPESRPREAVFVGVNEAELWKELKNLEI